jgi:aquaporin Z
MGFLVSKRMSFTEALGFWVAQFVGALLGAGALYAVFRDTPQYTKANTGLGTNGWGKASMIGMRVGGAFAAEVILTFLFVLVVLTVTSRIGNSNMAGLAIGLALTIVHLIGIPITGTSVNPARSFGPAVIVGGEAIRQLWLFIVAPLIGGAIAAGVHLFLVPAESDQALLIPDADTE